jgi:hypothetical protein
MVSCLAIQKVIKVEPLSCTEEPSMLVYCILNIQFHEVGSRTVRSYFTVGQSASLCLFLWRNTDLYELLRLLIHYSHVIRNTSQGCVIVLLLYGNAFSAFVALMRQRKKPGKQKVSSYWYREAQYQYTDVSEERVISTSGLEDKTGNVCIRYWGAFVKTLLLCKSNNYYILCVLCVCVCVVLGTQHVMRMRRIVICCPLYNLFPHYLTNGAIF